MGNAHSSFTQRCHSFDSAAFEAKKRTDSISKNSSTFAAYDSISRRSTMSPGAGKRKRFMSSESVGDYGWFEDTESPGDFCQQPLHRALTLPAPVSEPPMYVLESSLETQQLWYSTAGRRPAQPEQERKYFENLWKQNFEASEIPDSEDSDAQKGVKRRVPVSPIQKKASIPSIRVDHAEARDVLFRGKSPFSNSVSKSFDAQVSSMTIQLPYYRIIKDASGHLYAEYLIVVSLGGRGAVTFGIWKRHSDFSTLAKKISDEEDLSMTCTGGIGGIGDGDGIDEGIGMHTHNSHLHTFKNSLLSWQCVLERKRWFKSLDTDYLAVKCFLIERFLIDLLFEAPSPDLISGFLGLE
jgi:hypothetical protein